MPLGQGLMYRTDHITSVIDCALIRLVESGCAVGYKSVIEIIGEAVG